MNYEGTSLEIVLPHDFVQNASYPLIVDPLIGSKFLAGSTSHDLTPTTASSGVLLLAAGTGNVVPVCGACDLVVTTLAIPIPISAGNATFAATIPCDGSLAGAAIETQFLSLAPGSTTCSIAGVATSDILQISLDY